MNGSRRIGIVAVVVIAAAAGVVARRSGGCTWGTFSYSVGAKGAIEQTDLAVRREGREVVITRDGLAARSTLSPDARRVAFESARGGTYSDTVGYSTLAIHVADVGGGNREALTRGPYDENPSWAPDGERILFLREGAIWAVDVSTKEEELVHEPVSSDGDGVIDAEWSGDSSRIAFFVRTGPADEGAELWVVDDDGSDPRRLAGVEDGLVDELAWSPDGTTLAWSGFDQGVRSVFLMPLVIAVPRAIEPHAETPVWSREGERLAYAIGHEGHYRSRVVVGDANGESPERLPDSPEHFHDWVSC